MSDPLPNWKEDAEAYRLLSRAETMLQSQFRRNVRNRQYLEPIYLSIRDAADILFMCHANREAK